MSARIGGGVRSVSNFFFMDWDFLNIKSKNVKPLCKTYFTLNILKKLNINTGIYLGFGNKYNINYYNDNHNINKYENIKKIPNLCFHNAGNSSLHGTIELINVWLNNNINQLLIIIANNYNNYNENLFIYWNLLYNKIYKNTIHNKHLPHEILNICPKTLILPSFENIYSIYFLNYEKDKIDEKLITFLQTISDIHICPSIYNDWSQSIDDARLSKSLVITVDVEPLNILIDSTCGVLINTINKNYKNEINNKTTSLQNILPYDLIKYYPSEITINTNNFTSNELFRSIKEAFNINW